MPLIANAVVLWVGLPVAIWFFFIGPWRCDRRITLDSTLLLSGHINMDGELVLPEGTEVPPVIPFERGK